jgi:predicted RNA-binding protein YlxR (DUF448 family)
MKKVPERMCVACRAMKPKKELARVVRSPDGLVSLDLTGKSGGRGAYLCYDVNCLLRARKTRALERALSTGVDDAAYEQLVARMQEVTGQTVPESGSRPKQKKNAE